MPDEPEFLLWTEGLWRCEYWINDSAHGELRLYCHDSLQRTHQIAGGEAALAMSMDWRSHVLHVNAKIVLITHKRYHNRSVNPVPDVGDR